MKSPAVHTVLLIAGVMAAAYICFLLAIFNAKS